MHRIIITIIISREISFYGIYLFTDILRKPIHKMLTDTDKIRFDYDLTCRQTGSGFPKDKIFAPFVVPYH